MNKPCNRAFAITAGSIFLFAGLTLTILTIINLVQTLLSLFNGYSLPNQNVFINLLTIDYSGTREPSVRFGRSHSSGL